MQSVTYVILCGNTVISFGLLLYLTPKLPCILSLPVLVVHPLLSPTDSESVIKYTWQNQTSGVLGPGSLLLLAAQ